MNPTDVIFDLDGTLLDTLADIAEAANRALRDLGHPTHSEDDYRTLVGDGVVVLFERALPPEAAEDEARVAAGVAAFKRHYDTLWHRTSSPFPGIEAALKGLADRGLKLSVLSNKPHEFTVACVERASSPRSPGAKCSEIDPMSHASQILLVCVRSFRQPAGHLSIASTSAIPIPTCEPPSPPAARRSA